MKITKTVVEDIDLMDMRKALTSNFIGYKLKIRKDKYLDILSKIIKKYRWELLNTYVGYEIILNGNRALKSIRFENGDYEINANEILLRIETFDNDVGIKLP